MPRSTPADLARRRLLLATASGSLLLSGCQAFRSLSLFGETLGESRSDRQPDRYPRSRSEVDALPYAQLGVRIGEGAPGIMVLVSVQRGYCHWSSADRLQLSMGGNRIVAARGFGQDLEQVSLPSGDPFELGLDDPQRLDGLHFSRELQPRPGPDGRVTAYSRVHVEAPETLDLLDFKVNTLRVREELTVPAWQWRAENRFWMSFRSPLAWRSVQHLRPGGAPLRLDMLKRPALPDPRSSS